MWSLITYEFGVSADAEIPPLPNSVEVVGYASDGAIEALVVEVDGSSRRHDGSLYHITWSLEPGLRKPVDSNRLVQEGWQPHPRLPIVVVPALND